MRRQPDERGELVRLMGELARTLSPRSLVTPDRRYQLAVQLCHDHAARWGAFPQEFTQLCLDQFERELIGAGFHAAARVA